MTIIIIYSLIIFASTFLGAFVGLGGGVIIKPLLDLIGADSIDTVNFISSCAVFSMSISATIKHIRQKTSLDFKFIIMLSIGAVLGGVGGSSLFSYMLGIFNNDILKAIQGAVLGVLLLTAVIYINLKNPKSLHLKSPFAVIAVGLTLGFTASFLGIGGGPVNVAFLLFFFSMSIKEAAVYSVATIFFSQLSKLVTMGITSTVPSFDITVLIAAVCCAVLGGIAGAKMNKKFSDKVIKIVFTVVVSCLAVVNFYNALRGII